MIRSVGAVLAVVLVAASGCSNFLAIGDGPQVPIVRLRAEPYSFTFYSGITSSERIVVRDADSWRSVWAEIYKGYTPTPALPQVDFAQEMIVVAALGSRPTGGFGILFDDANEGDGGSTVVRVRTISPHSNCGVTTAVTSPVDIARLPRRDGGVHFVDRAVIHTCD